MTFYENLTEIHRTLDIQEVNDLIKLGWEVLKIAEVDAPTNAPPNQGAVPPVWRRTVLYILGKREKPSFGIPAKAPPTPTPQPQQPKAPAQQPQHNNDGPPMVTDKQLEYIAVLEKQSPAGKATIEKFLREHGGKKGLTDLTRKEAGDLIQFLK